MITPRGGRSHLYLCFSLRSGDPFTLSLLADFSLTPHLVLAHNTSQINIVSYEE